MDTFWKRVKKRPNGCWAWKGRHDEDGYALLDTRALYGRRETRASRISYILHNGPIDASLQVDHLCRNRGCVNPEHLELVTLQENSRRRDAARTHCVNGHPFDEKNTYHRPDGKGRECRACRLEASRRFASVS